MLKLKDVDNPKSEHKNYQLDSQFVDRLTLWICRKSSYINVKL